MTPRARGSRGRRVSKRSQVVLRRLQAAGLSSISRPFVLAERLQRPAMKGSGTRSKPAAPDGAKWRMDQLPHKRPVELRHDSARLRIVAQTSVAGEDPLDDPISNSRHSLVGMPASDGLQIRYRRLGKTNGGLVDQATRCRAAPWHWPSPPPDRSPSPPGQRPRHA